MIIVIIIIRVITCMQGIYLKQIAFLGCIYSVAAFLFLQSVLHVVLLLLLFVVGQAVGQFQSHYTYVALIYQLISNVHNRNAAL